MSSPSIPDQKDRLRKVLYTRRAAASKLDTGEAGALLADRIASFLGSSASVRTISAFLPIRTEIDTMPTIERLSGGGATVVLPTIVGDSPDLVFRTWGPGDPLAKGAFDVQEPLATAEERDPTTLIIPLLAFDRAGYRLGYGGGYYDRAIERLKKNGPVLAIGIAYDAQEVVHVPRESHDERLNAIVTPHRTFEFES